MDAKSESDGIQINVSNGASDVAILVGNIGDTPTKTMRDLLWEKLQDDDVRKATSDIIVSVEKREFPAHK